MLRHAVLYMYRFACDFQSLYQVAADVCRPCKQKGASMVVVSLVSAQRRAFAKYDLKVGNRLAQFKRYGYEFSVAVAPKILARAKVSRSAGAMELLLVAGLLE